MANVRSNNGDELYNIVDPKLTALIGELENMDFSADKIGFAIHDVLESKWLGAIAALQEARRGRSQRFGVRRE
ncbi:MULTISPECIES: hypothetical protein [unclassified Rhizobium]|uniref:hypothetical protein n=1 Tax=unclassified Rhizobium TaxID=2613769 RepID=UPI0017C39CC4|nr:MULTISPECIES: hypothetical protein [unclassified Rhizobium]MBB3320474.1 hypothetical protein [Rhizobium sp. BK181]MBB3545422.1 hypothetical protein [Rhizobium sp. BK399]